MALLVVRPRCCFPLRLLMASSSSSSSRFLTYSPSLTSSFPFTHRVKFRLKRVSSGAVSRNVAFPRAFMSSSTATEPSPARKASDSYGSEQIQVSEGLDPVRKRPGMYIGSTGRRGLHHLVYEILDNGVAEAQAGFASWIDVILLADNSVCISDNGRGVLHAGGKFGGSSSEYSVSGGLHVVGLSVVNALSEALEVTVWRDGMEYKQKYARGKPITDMSCHVLSPNSEDRRGTCIKFRPDREIFTTEIEFDYDTIAGRIRELAFLNPKLTIALSKESEDPEKNQYNEYYYAGGLVEYVNWLNTDKRPIHDVFGFHKEVDGVTIDAALQWSADAYSDTILGYANSIRTVDGGTHIDGFKASLTRTINNLGNKSKANKDKELTLSGEHIREGLTCVIAVKVPNPEFEGQTKTRLGNPEVRKVVDQCVQDYLSDYLELHPDVLENILSKALNSLKAALAAKKAREVLRQKSVLKSSSLHGKLADCFATNPEEAGMMFMPKRSGEFVQPKVVGHCPKVTWKQETMNVKKSKMGFPLGVMELEISPSREAKDNCIRESICESENANSRLTSLSSATRSHHFATTTIDEEANIDQMNQLSGEELHEFDDVAREALYANGLSLKKDFSDKLLSKESKGVSPSSTMGGKQITRKSKKTKSANGLSSVKELDEFPLLQETSFVSEKSAQLDGLDDAQMDDQQKLRTRLCSIFDKVLVVDNVALARKVVQMLTHQYRQHIHACDTEVSEIDVKQETPVDHGEIICFSIYSGKDVDFGNGKTCIWVDVLDGGGQDILAEFAPFFEDSTIKKVWHNYSFDCHVVENYGIKLSGFLADTMHMARLWDSSRRTDGGYSLEALTSNPDVMFENKSSQDEDLIGKISMKAIFGRRKKKKDGSLGKAVSLPSVEELQKEERLPWICYSSLDAMSTLKLYESLKSKLSKMPWVMNSTCKGNMLHFYENYWRPFGKILVQMETEGMLVDRSYLSEVEKVAIAQQKVAADRFRNWASKYCTDARFMNVGSDSQLRTLLFGGICNRKNHNEGLPTEKKFKVPNIENLIEEGKKTPKKYRDITLHKIGSNLQTDFYTLSGWPSVSGDALKAIAGKVSAEYDFSNDTPEDLLPDDPLDSGRNDVDISAYGTAYAAFGGGQEGREACHAIAALIEVCSIDSLISNFILPLQGSHVSGRNGRIHCSLNINTETGRLSARRPNLQNQPALEKDRYKIRQAFVASPGNSLIVADYGQLELRILAHLADCKSMKEAFEAGGDFHSRTAMNMYPYIREAVEREEVILEWHPQPGEEKPPVPLLKDAFGSERRKAKMLNFSIAYGKTPMGLAKDWKVSVKEAKGTVDLWYKERQEVLKWQEARKKEAAKRSCVHTLLGRARRFPSMANASPPQRSHIERAAINTPVQGSAADVAMCAMLEIDSNKRLKELGWKLLLQVHDEVILEGPSETEEEAKGLVIECMSKPFNGRNILTVELAVDAKCAQNWYAAK